MSESSQGLVAERLRICLVIGRLRFPLEVPLLLHSAMGFNLKADATAALRAAWDKNS